MDDEKYNHEEMSEKLAEKYLIKSSRKYADYEYVTGSLPSKNSQYIFIMNDVWLTQDVTRMLELAIENRIEIHPEGTQVRVNWAYNNIINFWEYYSLHDSKLWATNWAIARCLLVLK